MIDHKMTVTSEQLAMVIRQSKSIFTTSPEWETRFGPSRCDPMIVLSDVVRELVWLLEENDPLGDNFNRQKFMDACGIQFTQTEW